MKFFQLFIRYQIRRLRHLVDGALRLRERDDVADRLAVEHEHDEAVKPVRNARMRRRAVFERIQQESEFFLCVFFRNADRLEYFSCRSS